VTGIVPFRGVEGRGVPLGRTKPIRLFWQLPT
jgi:hypothetical protein